MKNFKSLQNKIKTLPKSPGCYIYKNKKGKILYVGKAVNLRSRVSSYFSNYPRLDPKMRSVVDQIRDIEFVTTDSNVEALILETNLIKKYKPKYNRMMKDDKNYAWLMITKGEDFPRIEFIRDRKIKSADYFGPYVDMRPIKRALKQLRAIFPYRSCQRKMYFFDDKKGQRQFYSSNKKPCLYYHLKLCNAPCAKFTTKKDYRENINNIKRFFRSDKSKIIKDLRRHMAESAKQREFERAAEIRDKLEDLTFITQRIEIEKDVDEIVWKEKKEKRNVESLKQLINKLQIPELNYHKKFKIECYDISNISGKSATGSMIVFVNGKPDKSLYRKFKIKTKDTPDDYSMLKEVFERRFTKKKKSNDDDNDKSFSEYPALLIIDGGKGQLSSVLKILADFKLKIPAVGLAKREEEIFKVDHGEFKLIKLRNKSNESFLVQRIRDEAHRFAIKYHRKLRSKKLVKSLLDDIPGIGKVVKLRLLKAFGSTEGIKKASKKDLETVVKNRRTVENIKKLL